MHALSEVPHFLIVIFSLFEATFPFWPIYIVALVHLRKQLDGSIG